MGFLKGFDHIGVPTQNFEKSIPAYESLGFTFINEEDENGHRVGFFQLNDLLLEVYEGESTSEFGTINHIAIATDDIEGAFKFIDESEFELIDHEIVSLPFWDYGIRYFKFFGPNKEILEVCQKNKA